MRHFIFAHRHGVTEDPSLPAPQLSSVFLCIKLWPQIVWNVIRAPKLSSNGEPGLPNSVALATSAHNTASSSLPFYLQNAQLSFKPARCLQEPGRQAGGLEGGWVGRAGWVGVCANSCMLGGFPACYDTVGRQILIPQTV